MPIDLVPTPETNSVAGENRPAAVTPAPAASAPAPAAAGADVAAATPALPNKGVTAAPAPVSAAPQSPQMGMGKKVLNAILGALGGTEDIAYSRDADGKLVVTKRAIGPGMAAKRIIAGALTGIAGAASVEPGPGHEARSFGAGFGANQQRLDKQDVQKRRDADQDFANSQEVLKNKATMAHLAALTAQSAMESKRLGVEINDKLASGFTAMQGALAADPQNHALGTFGSFGDFLNSSSELQQQVAKQMPHGRIQPLVHPDGSVTAYAINEAWDLQKVSSDMPLPVFAGMDAKGKPIYTNHTIKAGTASNGDYRKWMMATWVEQQKVALDAWKENETNKRAANVQAGENARLQKTLDSREDIAKQKAEIDKLKLDKQGDKDLQKVIDTNNKNYVKPANDVEKSFGMMSHAYQEYLQAKAAGKELPTGAQSMLALSTHLATTFGNVKGSRVTKDMIQHHLGARSITDSALVAVQRLTNGDVLSGDQWAAFNDLIGTSRRLSWETAVKEAYRAKVPIDFVPEDLHGMAEEATQPKGATGAVWSADGRRLLGHVVGTEYVPLGGKK